jgi:hypothetical protein
MIRWVTIEAGLLLFAVCVMGCRKERAHKENVTALPVHVVQSLSSTSVYGVMTETAYADSTGEAPMIQRLYSKKDLDDLIVPGMTKDAIIARFGHPFIVTTKASGSEDLEFLMNPLLVPRNIQSQMIGFDVVTRDGVVVGWKPGMVYGIGP